MKNTDFAHLVSFDLNLEKRKYGVLPVRMLFSQNIFLFLFYSSQSVNYFLYACQLKDISLTPYSDPLAILLPAADFGEPDEAFVDGIGDPV